MNDKYLLLEFLFKSKNKVDLKTIENDFKVVTSEVKFLIPKLKRIADIFVKKYPIVKKYNFSIYKPRYNKYEKSSMYHLIYWSWDQSIYEDGEGKSVNKFRDIIFELTKKELMSKGWEYKEIKGDIGYLEKKIGNNYFVIEQGDISTSDGITVELKR